MIIFGFITAILIASTTGSADDKSGTLDARVDGCPSIRSSRYSTTTGTTSRWRHSALGSDPLHCFCTLPLLWLANRNLRETLKLFGHLFQNVITRIVVGISWAPCQRCLGCAQQERDEPSEWVKTDPLRLTFQQVWTTDLLWRFSKNTWVNTFESCFGLTLLRGKRFPGSNLCYQRGKLVKIF